MQKIYIARENLDTKEIEKAIIKFDIECNIYPYRSFVKGSILEYTEGKFEDWLRVEIFDNVDSELLVAFFLEIKEKAKLGCVYVEIESEELNYEGCIYESGLIEKPKA